MASSPPEPPELYGYPSEEKRVIWNRISNDAGWHWRVYVVSIGGGLLVIGSLWLMLLATEYVPSKIVPERLLRGLVVAAVLGLLLIYIRWLSPALLRWLAGRLIMKHVPHLCGTCGYDLTANASGVCPECGREIEQRSSDKVE